MDNFDVDDDETLFSIYTNFSTQLYCILHHNYQIFIPSTSYKFSSPRATSFYICTSLCEAFTNSPYLCIENSRILHQKLKKPFKKPDFWPFDINNVRWK